MGIGELIADGQLLVAVVIALAAGLVSFASPCVLPLVPGYLAYIGGLAGNDSVTVDEARRRPRERRRLVLGVALFVAGFSLIFTLFMVLAGSVGVWLVQYQDIITRVLGVLVIVMGLVFIGAFRIFQTTRKLNLAPRVGLVGAPILGAGFAIGWTPCLGPTLIAITSLSLQSGSALRGAILGIAYCIGLGIPFVLVAFGFGWVSSSTNFLRRHIRTINIIGGAALILIGLLMVTGVWNSMMYGLQAVMNGYVTPL